MSTVQRSAFLWHSFGRAIQSFCVCGGANMILQFASTRSDKSIRVNFLHVDFAHTLTAALLEQRLTPSSMHAVRRSTWRVLIHRPSQRKSSSLLHREVCIIFAYMPHVHSHCFRHEMSLLALLFFGMQKTFRTPTGTKASQRLVQWPRQLHSML